jgi:phosphoglycolate phosphatase-like HAD superfamily hydrolase
MTSTRPEFLLCLDFDGVICDSARECFVSSWMAYHHLVKKEQPSYMPVDLLKEFLTLRPFIRAGGDYVFIQEMLETGVVVKDQEDFDSFTGPPGSDKVREYKEIFYQARESVMAGDRDYWIGLNRVYHHMIDPLKSLAAKEALHIVSTKRPDFIVEILNTAGVEFPPKRIHYSYDKGKLEIVAEILAETGVSRAVFVDDQIDHLRDGNSNVECWLAAWGYVKDEWLESSGGVGVLDTETMGRIFDRV